MEQVEQFFRQLIFGPIVKTPEEFILSFLVLLGLSVFVAWVGVVILSRFAYVDKYEQLIDADMRVTLCWSLAFIIVMFLVVVNVLYLWLRNRYGGDLGNLGPHALVYVALFIIWFLLHRGLRNTVNRLKRTIPS